MYLAAEIILPLPVRSNFHYRVKEDQREALAIGKRVLVNFGKSKIYTGLVKATKEFENQAEFDRLKEIEEILDEEPVITPNQLKLFNWIAYYYMCTEGEVFKAALPVGLKPESALRVEVSSPDLEWENLPLDDKEFLLLEALSIQPQLGFKEVAEIWQINNPNPRLKTMAARGYIKLSQQVEQRYKAKFKSFLRLPEALQKDEAKLKAAFDSLGRAPQQENLMMRVTEAFFQGKTLPKTEILKELGIGGQIVKSLINKAFLEEEKVQVDRMELYGYKQHTKEIILTPQQERVMLEIKTGIEIRPRKPILLHGITGSGKTHLYIELIKEVLEEGRQILYLLPEITLTKQIIDRVKSAFGERVGIYHSRFNDHERVEIWNKVRKREYDIVIGVRSSVFLPFQDLGLIVVDEEHDQSFKQHEPAPRYNARDLAIYYSLLVDCPVILGSATPSFESYRNALAGKYVFVELLERATKATLPQIQIVDMRVQKKKRLVDGVFSKVLEDAIAERLAKGEQVILFQNRRGYAPYLICDSCGHVPQCINCDISLTFHKEKKHLRCHYCGHTDFGIEQCQNCGNYTLRWAGIGTEQIAEQVASRFPDHVVERMDLDTTRSKNSYQLIISRFEAKQVDILVGTQMVSKGLDFENVTLVGVINADNILSFPDFRAFEQAYQLLTQVSGRAGRSEKKGEVFIQTLMPENIVLEHLQKPYRDFYEQEILGREQLGYPPYSRVIRIEIKHKDRRYIEQEALRLYNLFKPQFGPNLLGPDYALVARVRNQYRMQFMIKIGRKVSASKLREALHKLISLYYEQAPQKTLRIILDIDPM
ncbi:MAG: primosomal protein N' [Bacteroidota bacterium]